MKIDFPPIYKNGLYSVGVLILIDWILRKDERLKVGLLINVNKRYAYMIEAVAVIVVVYLISLNSNSNQFIYFQF